MGTINITSNPAGAEVLIDGNPIGHTPMTIPIESSVSELDTFRTECLSSGVVSCDWETLKTRLEDHTVSRLWWDITRKERYSITEMAADRTIPKDARYSTSGSPNCAGVGTNATWINAVCVCDALIKYVKFVDKNVQGADKCYYKLKYTTEEPICYVPDKSYNLPGVIVSYSAPMGDRPTGYGHSMFAILIDHDKTNLDNWIIFQYRDFDIKHGNWQMPEGPWENMRLRMYEMGVILPGCTGIDNVIDIAEWNYVY